MIRMFVFSTGKLPILGYKFEDGQIRPDPDCICSLLVLLTRDDMKSLHWVLRAFSHHYQWIRGYSEKVQQLIFLCLKN